ncbi:YqaA family protein [Bacillus sp. Marseille-P3661]|uniref:YqaA family protein n=1 Tax=Bacillus sp. Marseille-P3661 TaxID=1936234 RepID=UPI002155D573|nr:YqaA family protein [Bacillus sp. Marseille-P3661]
MFESIVEILNEWGVWGLAITSFLESSFFPIPPDVLLIPMSIARPELALYYAFVTTVASVLGALLGYVIGVYIGKPILRKITKETTIMKAETMFRKYGGFSLAFAGFTPIPFKVFTILGGSLKMSLMPFIVGSIIGRGGRFFLEAFVIIYFGEKAAELIESYSVPFTLAIGLVAIIAVVLFYKFKNKF